MRFFLCDDTQEMRAVYEEKIKEICSKHNIDFEIVSYYSGEQMLFDYENQNSFNGVIFLDINMPEINGITVSQRLQQMGCLGEIIFLTVSESHFLQAFDVGATNYIVKGKTTAKRFENILLNAVNTVSDRQEEFMVFTCAGERRSVRIRDITYFEVTKRIMTVHYKGDETFSFLSSIGMIEDQLFHKGFVRIHRAFLVSVRHIEKVSYTELTLRNNTSLPVGRKYYARIKSALEDKSANLIK